MMITLWHRRKNFLSEISTMQMLFWHSKASLSLSLHQTTRCHKQLPLRRSTVSLRWLWPRRQTTNAFAWVYWTRQRPLGISNHPSHKLRSHRAVLYSSGSEQTTLLLKQSAHAAINTSFNSNVTIKGKSQTQSSSYVTALVYSWQYIKVMVI